MRFSYPFHKPSDGFIALAGLLLKRETGASLENGGAARLL